MQSQVGPTRSGLTATAPRRWELSRNDASAFRLPIASTGQAFNSVLLDGVETSSVDFSVGRGPNFVPNTVKSSNIQKGGMVAMSNCVSLFYLSQINEEEPEDAQA